MHPRDQTIFALSSGRPPSAIAIVRVSGPRGRNGADGARRQNAGAANGDAGRCSAMSASGRSTMRWCSGFRVRPARPAKTSRNFTSMAGAPCWLRFVRGAVGIRKCARRRARRIHPPRVRERQARSHRSRRSRRSHPRRHRPATPPGAASVEGRARRQSARLARADHRGVRADRSRHRFFRRGRCAGGIDRAGAGEDQSAAEPRSKKCLRHRAKANACAMVSWSRSPARRMSASRR